MLRPKAAVGVDIGSSTVKVVQLRRTGSGVELEKAAVVPIYPDGERPGDPSQQRRAKVDAVRRAISTAGISAKNAVTSVSGESIIVRYLQLPEMPEDELKKALQWEAEEYIPFRLDEVNIDSMVLGQSEGDGGRVDVLLVSAKKDLVEEHLGIIREAGLTPKIVDVDSFAFLNCYENNYDISPEECIALVNIGAEITGISILIGNTSRFTRDISVGGEKITSAIRSHLRCAYAEAESLKLTHGAAPPNVESSAANESAVGGLADTIRGTVESMTTTGDDAVNPEDQVASAVQGVLGELVSEVRRSIEFFENQMRGTSVSRVVLGGGGSMLANLRGHFEKELGLPTEVIDPLNKVRPSAKNLSSSEIDGMRHTLGVGIGLGLRGLAA